jgi:thiazolylpeptide-type bacteriocin precursor
MNTPVTSGGFLMTLDPKNDVLKTDDGVKAPETEEVHQLEVETFEIEDFVDANQNMADLCSTSCTSTCSSTSTDSCSAS